MTLRGGDARQVAAGVELGADDVRLQIGADRRASDLGKTHGERYLAAGEGRIALHEAVFGQQVAVIE